mgnify:CR=1 FL=1
MELRHLQYFLMIAREGTISGAAQALHLSQPSLSRQMHDLERELGCKLFDRGSRHIELTEAGMRLRRRAEEIIDLVGRTESELLITGSTLSGEVRIGGGETQTMALIADVIAELQETYPLIRFSLVSGNAELVDEWLNMGRLDVGMFIGYNKLDRYETLSLPACDTWGVLMRRDDPLAQAQSIHVNDLVGLPLVLSRQADRAIQSWFGDQLPHLDVVATYNLLFNATLLARRGVGYVVCLDGIVETSEESGLAFRPLEPALHADVTLAWKRYQAFSPASEVFLKRIRELWG